MKKDIHPKMNNEVTASCACGNSFITQSTAESIKVDICSACHPLYTGKQKFIDTEGRIDKFKKKMEIAEKKKAQASTTKKAKKKSNVVKKSLKEALKDA